MPDTVGKPFALKGAARQQTLERRVAKQQAVAALGLRALAGASVHALAEEAVVVVATTLGVELCKVLELLPNGEALRLRAGVGWQEGLVGVATVGSGLESQAGYTLASSEPVVVQDLRTETRFHGPRLLFDHGVVSGLSVIIHGSGRPWGVLGAHTARRRDFDEDDISFVQSIANVLAAAIDRARTVDALTESEERFRTLVEMAPDAIFSVTASDGSLSALSPAFERLTGWNRDEWLGRSFTGLIDPVDLPLALDYFTRVLSGESPDPFHLRVRRADGAVIAGEFRIAPKLEDGRVGELFGIARDVSDRLRAEEELRRSRDELEVILRGVADGITVQDTSGRLVYANDTAARLIGCASVEELLATPAPELLRRFEVFDATGRPFPMDRLPGRLALLGLPAPETIVRFRVVATGEERWSIVNATAVFNPDGTPRYAINIFHDVTERKRTEIIQDFMAEATSLLASSLDYEATLARVAHGAVPFLADLCVFDIVQPDGSVRRVAAHSDPETERIIYDLITRQPLEPEHPVMVAIRTGKPTLFRDLDPESPQVANLAPERARVIRALGFRSVIVMPLASRGRVIGALSLMYAESGRHYAETDLEAARELARRSATAIDNALLLRDAEQAANRLRALAEASRAFAEASLDLPAVLEAVARSAGELIGDQCILRLLDDDGNLPAAALYHPDPERLASLTEFMRGKLQRADEGYVGQVMQSGEPVLVPTIPRPVLEATVTSAHRDYVQRVPLHSIVIVPLRVHEQVIGTLGLGRERPGDPYSDEDLLLLGELADRAGLAIENARLYREARDAVRAREQFLSIASHELKTPLTSVKATAQLLDRRLRQGPVEPARVEPLIDQLQGEIGRLESLVTDLLDATRIQQGRLELRLEEVDLVALVRQVIGRFELAPQRLASHELTLQAPESIIARVDPDRIDQVVTNLVSNGLKYSPDGGEVRVEVRAREDAVEVAVIDHGIGISAAEQERLFEPFARGELARQSIGGTGLGLFISCEIVERHGGEISVESEPGRGSVFTVRLPGDAGVQP